MTTSSKKATDTIKTKNLDPSKYVNVDSGELLKDEIKNASLQIVDKTGYVVISSDDYTILDSNAISFLKNHLNRSELGSLSIISEDLKTPYNIVYNNNVPHTNESLQIVLNIASNSTFNLLIKKLMKLGVLYQIKGNIMGKIRVIYMMNPFVARKRKHLDEKLIEIFKDFNT